MSLFTKPINEITIDDVETFCKQGIGEGVRMEYKKDFSGKNANKQIAKEVASFANTYGGLLLIGVDEDDRKPKMPLSGIDFKDGLEEKIVSIALKGINPPVFPEIQVCKLKETPDKAIIVIRVHESDETPHRIEQDTKIYIRAASQSEPTLAPFEEIEWLINRRKKAITNRERLLKRAHKRFAEKYTENEPGGTIDNFHYLNYLPPNRGMSIIPLYPHRELTRYSELPNRVVKTAVWFSASEFPINVHNGVALQESIIFSSSMPRNDSLVIKHTEINSFGLIFQKESIFETSVNGEQVIEAPMTLEMIYKTLLFAKKFYEETGFWGVAYVRLFFESIQGRALTLPYPLPSGHKCKQEFDHEINIERKVSVFKLSDDIEEIVLDLYKEFLWSFGAKALALNDEVLKQHIGATKREIA